MLGAAKSELSPGMVQGCQNRGQGQNQQNERTLVDAKTLLVALEKRDRGKTTAKSFKALKTHLRAPEMRKRRWPWALGYRQETQPGDLDIYIDY